jgi:hypothetical protein
VSVSTDGGLTWASHLAWQGAFDEATKIGDNADKIFGTISVDRSGQVHVLLPVRTRDDPVGFVASCETNPSCQEQPQPTNLQLVTSPDGGAHWTAPFQVNATAGSYFFPWIATGSSGRIDAIYYQTDSLRPNDATDRWSAGFAQITHATATVGPKGARYKVAPQVASLLLDLDPVHVGGRFTVLGLSGSQNAVIPAAATPARFLVRGRYVEFTVVAATFGIEDYTFTGAPNPLDLTGGRRTVVYASNTPDHRGLALESAVTVRINGGDLVLNRSGRGLSMKIQAKDCASGGIFQMEPARADGSATRITHMLAPGIFYFDNPNFRAREGDVVPFGTTTLTVKPRINLAGDVSPKLVGRDSAQVATRVLQGCMNSVPAPRQPGGRATVDHCGGVSVWDEASGGRMGGVFGEDAVEVSPSAEDCVRDCQAARPDPGQGHRARLPLPGADRKPLPAALPRVRQRSPVLGPRSR